MFNNIYTETPWQSGMPGSFLLAAAAADDHAGQGVIEFHFVAQLLERQVHAVAPVVTRVGRHVDSLLVRILEAELGIH